MQNPQRDIAVVFALVTSAVSPDIQRETIMRYFTEDVGFRHPLFTVTRGPMSREDVLGIYQFYRVLSPNIDVDVKGVAYEPHTNTLVLDITQLVHVRFSPFKPVPSNFKVHLKLHKKKKLFYIASQEDLYQPDEFLNLICPPAVPLLRLALSAAGFATAIGAKAAQVLGFWRVGGGEIIPNDSPSNDGSQDSKDTELNDGGEEIYPEKEEHQL